MVEVEILEPYVEFLKTALIVPALVQVELCLFWYSRIREAMHGMRDRLQNMVLILGGLDQHLLV
jgi:hypothetical protein